MSWPRKHRRSDEILAAAYLDERESVWDYPRPPRLERVDERLRVELAGEVLAETEHGWRLLETSHPPTYYFPPSAVRRDLLVPAAGRSLCEFKGQAHYWTVELRGRRVERVAWSYPDPWGAYAPVADHFAFYASKVDACWVGDELARAQAGDFYGGWITDRIAGPFKGPPGTRSW
ncbi:Uncharacterized conserved protein, DUF427 family [Tistlia consotensis]|uniref:Uncharacterized conserved protein, DUF427 family n=1 Tax=Tistlia consotensis USBA 355 TaxID=560819 RepID=A0A1Y6CMV4_9PROT|nr:DUF427 domain-containing protein [Tistlia consotensis]SMF78455.1 Uncharacterized conserved protein, DUF427 family [Tistlia consotensis USBA 355]SNS18551.1 Uncharacterized conserved protein, DUF427 family [Tistlia consotensis]